MNSSEVKDSKVMGDNTDLVVKRPMWLRVVAWIGILILIGMYVVTLVVAVTNTGNITNLLMGCIGATIFVPVILWINLRLWQLSMERNRQEYRETIGQEGESPDTRYVSGESDDKAELSEDGE